MESTVEDSAALAFEELVATLQNGGIAVVRTDTLYGLIALAANQSAVEAVYAAKQRNQHKACIVLVARSQDVPAPYRAEFERYATRAVGPTSIIVPAPTEPAWLLRGGISLAYRVVWDPFLRQVIETVGPVIAPSANPEGLPPARTIQQARAYFGDTVGCYVDGGTVPQDVQASHIIELLPDGTSREVRAA